MGTLFFPKAQSDIISVPTPAGSCVPCQLKGVARLSDQADQGALPNSQAAPENTPGAGSLARSCPKPKLFSEADCKASRWRSGLFPGRSPVLGCPARSRAEEVKLPAVKGNCVFAGSTSEPDSENLSFRSQEDDFVVAVSTLALGSGAPDPLAEPPVSATPPWILVSSFKN